MNTERLTYLAEWLEGGATHKGFRFDMATGLKMIVDEAYNPDDPEHNFCETQCCIAGATVQFFGVFDGYNLTPDDVLEDGFWRDDDPIHTVASEQGWDSTFEHAQELLDLSYQQATALFLPGEGTGLSQFNDPAWAARTIRHLIATGVVDWNATDHRNEVTE